MSENFKRYGIIALIALLLILLGITASAVKIPFMDLFGFSGEAEGKATIFIILAVLFAVMGFVDTFMGSTIRSWPAPVVAGEGANPAIVAIVNSFIRILLPFYVILIIITGLYLMFLSGSPAGRARAKSMLQKLITSIILIPLSLPMFQILLNIASALTTALANIMDLNILLVIAPFNILLIAFMASITQSSTLTIIAGSIILIVNLLIGLVIAARYLFLLILAMLFPFTIFLWYVDIPFAKGLGMALMRWTFIWTFVSVVFVLIAGASQIAMMNYYKECSLLNQGILAGTTLASIAISFGNIAGGIVPGWHIGSLGIIFFLFTDMDCFMTVFLSFAGTLLMVLTPLFMVGILRWIGGSMVLFGLSNYRRPIGELATLAGGTMAGMGPGVLILYGTQTSFRKQMQRYLPIHDADKEQVNPRWSIINGIRARIFGIHEKALETPLEYKKYVNKFFEGYYDKNGVIIPGKEEEMQRILGLKKLMKKEEYSNLVDTLKERDGKERSDLIESLAGKYPNALEKGEAGFRRVGRWDSRLHGIYMTMRRLRRRILRLNDEAMDGFTTLRRRMTALVDKDGNSLKGLPDEVVKKRLEEKQDLYNKSLGDIATRGKKELAIILGEDPMIVESFSSMSAKSVDTLLKDVLDKSSKMPESELKNRIGIAGIKRINNELGENIVDILTLPQKEFMKRMERLTEIQTDRLTEAFDVQSPEELLRFRGKTENDLIGTMGTVGLDRAKDILDMKLVGRRIPSYGLIRKKIGIDRMSFDDVSKFDIGEINKIIEEKKLKDLDSLNRDYMSRLRHEYRDFESKEFWGAVWKKTLGKAVGKVLPPKEPSGGIGASIGNKLEEGGWGQA